MHHGTYFDLKRKVILIVGRDKSDGSEKGGIDRAIARADKGLDAHLVELRKKERK